MSEEDGVRNEEEDVIEARNDDKPHDENQGRIHLMKGNESLERKDFESAEQHFLLACENYGQGLACLELGYLYSNVEEKMDLMNRLKFYPCNIALHSEA